MIWCAAFKNDFYRLDLTTFQWTLLGRLIPIFIEYWKANLISCYLLSRGRNIVSGQVPSARVKFAFTAIGNFLFCFGGQFYSSSSNLAGTTGIKFHEICDWNFWDDFCLAGNLFRSFASVGLSDLYMFDPLLLKWTRVDQNILGVSPKGRYDAGFAAAGSWFCLFGGVFSRSSGICFLQSLEKPMLQIQTSLAKC